MWLIVGCPFGAMIERLGKNGHQHRDAHHGPHHDRGGGGIHRRRTQTDPSAGQRFSFTTPPYPGWTCADLSSNPGTFDFHSFSRVVYYTHEPACRKDGDEVTVYFQGIHDKRNARDGQAVSFGSFSRQWLEMGRCVSFGGDRLFPAFLPVLFLKTPHHLHYADVARSDRETGRGAGPNRRDLHDDKGFYRHAHGARLVRLSGGESIVQGGMPDFSPYGCLVIPAGFLIHYTVRGRVMRYLRKTVDRAGG